MDLFEYICPLCNIAIATISIAQLRFVAWQPILKAAAAAANVSAVDKKNDDHEEEVENNKNGRIRAILSSFQQGTAHASDEQALLLELKDYFASYTAATEVFGCRIADLEMAVTTLLLPKTLTQLLDCFMWYVRKSKKFRCYLQRSCGVDFHASLLDTKNNIPAAVPCAAAEDTAAAGGVVPSQKNKPFASLRRRSTKTATTSSSSSTSTMEPMLVAWNNYRVDTGPSGKELIYMIFLDKCQERIIVTFRTSITLSDWAHDIRVNMYIMSNPFFSSSEPPTSSSHHHAASQDKEKQGGGGSGGGGSSSSSLLQERQRETLRIHAGFYQYLCKADPTNGEESKFDQISRKLHDLLKQYPTYKVAVTGHSLGGAMSTLFAFMAVAAAATSETTTRGDSKDNDDVHNNGAKKDMLERIRMRLPTPNKVARLFGGATAAAEPGDPPSVMQENNHAAANNNDDNQAKEVEHSGIDTEGSFFHIGLPTPITVVSFGSPPVGNDAFCRAFFLLEERGILRHLRITNEDDIIPSIPVSSILTTLGRVYLYRHTGIHLLQLSQTIPTKQFYRWCSRKMNKKKQSDPGSALFRICYKHASHYTIAKDVTVIAHDFADAVAGVHLRALIPHFPANYHKRLHRIEVYLRRLSLDQLYQEYLLDDFNYKNNNDDDDNDDETMTRKQGQAKVE